MEQDRPQRVNAIRTTLMVAVFLATIFVALPPQSFSTAAFSERLALIRRTQPAARPGRPASPAHRHRGRALGQRLGRRLHRRSGEIDLTEAEVNLNIATLVQKKLVDRGFQVDLLNEFDTRLNGYRAVAIVSIHNDSCEYINDQATGFKMSAALNTRDVNRANRLVACMVDRYGAATGLSFHAGSITADMTGYHAFSEIDPNTIAGIIETGFLNLDRDLLTQHADQVADGVVNGLMCFIDENVEPLRCQR
jgi:N-acetylmuramoyl-L-alanine amidase